jgi:dTDP-glucose 4,6-dehydratase
MKLLITGGAGFIGSHVVRRFVLRYPEYEIHNLDALTYAGNLTSLKDIQEKPNYHFHNGDIRDPEFLMGFFSGNGFEAVIHLAAESHVDRSILEPSAFVETNVQGTVNLMEAAVYSWKGDFSKNRFYHISTDEVYGSLGESGFFDEDSLYKPNSPYASSKAAADHFVRAYGNTYGLPFLISNCSNNFGPNQFPEKLVPLCINNIVNLNQIPVYGQGNNIRDWLFVKDHAHAIDSIFHHGRVGETYCIGGGNEFTNLELVNRLCGLLDVKLNRTPGSSAQLITFIKDRPGHDLRYAIDDQKIRAELGWAPSTSFEDALEQTVSWYLDNDTWLQQVTSGTYKQYYQAVYGNQSGGKTRKA